jgi:hypothetical protein
VVKYKGNFDLLRMETNMVMVLFRRWGERKRRATAARYEEMRRISDNFGWGPILRYGEDRYGKSYPDRPETKSSSQNTDR